MNAGAIEYQEVVDAEGNVVDRIPLQFGEQEFPQEDPDSGEGLHICTRSEIEWLSKRLPDAQPGRPIRSGLKARPLADQRHRPTVYRWSLLLFHVVGPIVVAIGVVVIAVSLLRIGGLM